MLEMVLKNCGNEWGKYKSCDSSNSRDFSEEKLPTFDSDSDYDNDYEDDSDSDYDNDYEDDSDSDYDNDNEDLIVTVIMIMIMKMK